MATADYFSVSAANQIGGSGSGRPTVVNEGQKSPYTIALGLFCESASTFGIEKNAPIPGVDHSFELNWARLG